MEADGAVIAVQTRQTKIKDTDVILDDDCGLCEDGADERRSFVALLHDDALACSFCWLVLLYVSTLLIGTMNKLLFVRYCFAI